MDFEDVSIHGLPLGPVPIVVSLYSLFVFIRILRGKAKLNRDNTVCPLGFVPLVVALGAAFLGIRDRGDLSGSIHIISGGAGIIMSFIFSSMIHKKAKIPIWHRWVSYEALPTKELIKQLAYALALVAAIIWFDAVMGPELQMREKCSTGPCRIVAIAFGSNLSAAGELWMTTFIFSIIGMPIMLTARELISRLLLSISNRIGGN